jgi:hypothetical protein
MTTEIKLDEFTIAYIEAALWSSTDESDEFGGEPMDKNYSTADLSPEALAKIQMDCDRFQSMNCRTIIGREEQAGHDFWLTRNRHGAGFWDGDWEERTGAELTEYSHKQGECNLYVGDDGLLYLS